MTSSMPSKTLGSASLPLPPEGHAVPVLPSSVPGATDGLGKPVSLAQAPGFLASGGESPELPVLVLVGGVLAHPVRVHDAETAEGLADALFGHGLDAALELEVVDTLVDGLAVGGTFGGQPLPAAPADADAEYAETLLSLVAHLPGLGRPGRR